MLLSVLLSVACVNTTPAPPSSPEGSPPPAASLTPTPIRVGWQTTWATQGQLAVILMKTDILQKFGFEGDFKGFSYGGPLNEGALAGEVDVLFTADQPALSLMSRDEDWQIVGRLMYNRVGTVVPPDSPVQSPADLRDRTVAVPFGAAAHRETLRALRASGLVPGEQVQVVNLGLEELVALIGAGASQGRWGTIDAGGAWDPAFADLEHRGVARTIAQGVVTSVVVMDGGYTAQHPDAEARFMQAMLEAYGWYRTHTDLANQWFKDTAKLPFDLEVLEKAASVEPNLQAAHAEGLQVTLSPADLAGLQQTADFMLEAGLLKSPMVVAARVRGEATAGLKPPTPGQVRLVE